MEIKLIELKFLLKLLSKTDYRAPITEVNPNSGTKASKRKKICRDLRDRQLVACSEEITKIKATPPGKALLKLEQAELPVTPQEVKIIKACEKGTITPGKTKVTPAKTRETSIQSLVERGLIEAAERKIKAVWLTKRGQEYLLYEYHPGGNGNTHLTKSLLGEYLRFLRSSLSQPEQADGVMHNPSDKEILQAIADLDRALGTDNYLPIFHLRQKLQPPLSREDLDCALYRLEKNNQIELSALQETMHYTTEQIQAGIPQDVGGSLFFIVVS